MILPPDATPLLAALTPVFSQATATRSVILFAAALLTTGRRTAAALLRTLGRLAPGHVAPRTSGCRPPPAGPGSNSAAP